VKFIAVYSAVERCIIMKGKMLTSL